MEIDERDLAKIRSIIYTRKGVDFTSYKQTTITRRILRRLILNKHTTLKTYIKFLNDEPSEVELLYRDLLINVTSFFREPGLYQAYVKRIFHNLFAKRKPADPIRVWVPACATGEEACSIAICLMEYLGDNAESTLLQVFATDLSDGAIEKARTGIYTKSALENVPPAYLKKYFTKIDGSYQVIKPIRDACIFATHNLMKDPPFSRMDIISCQNVMIYLDTTAQKKILQSFHYSLKPNGCLVLGKSETIGTSTGLFEQSDKEYKIYCKKIVSNTLQFEMTAPATPYPGAKKRNNHVKQPVESEIEKNADKVLLTRYVPASVLVNKELQIVRFNGATAGFLQPSSGKASLHLLKMVREELAFDLRTLLHSASKEYKPVKKEGIIIKNQRASAEVSIEVLPVKTDHPSEQYFLIIFKEQAINTVGKVSKVAKPLTSDNKDKRIAALEASIDQAREQMRSMNEEFEATKEELQSANEEILSSNEELQSINEELETSKEEVQSTNEELTTINDELQNRNKDLKEAVEFSELIIETIREPLIVLNNDLRIRSANKAFYQNFRLSSDDTDGYYLYEIQNGDWNIPELHHQLSNLSVNNLAFVNMEITQTFGRIGEKTLSISAMRMNESKRKSKILLAIADMTERKKTELQLKENEERFRLLVQNSFDVIGILLRDGTIDYLSESIERITGYTAGELIGKNMFSNGFIHPEDKAREQQLLKQCATRPGNTMTSEFRMRTKKGDYRIIESVALNLLDNPRVNGIVVNHRDVTDRRILEKQKEDFIGVASHELRTPLTSIKGYTELLQELFEGKNDEALSLVEKTDKQVQRLSNLVKDLLDVTKISEGQLEMHGSDFSMNELISEIVEEMEPAYPQHQFIQELQKAKKIIGDRERMGQVIINLLSNAAKYSPSGGKIIIRSVAGTKQLTVSVEDFGIGMDDDIKDKVFDRFFRASGEKAKTFPGLGLGLYIASTIITKHNGSIHVETKKTGGCIFSFSIPFNNPLGTEK
jgi:two-component system CheB/CheR fusion protein